jgi:hypothetical protein
MSLEQNEIMSLVSTVLLSSLAFVMLILVWSHIESNTMNLRVLENGNW